MMSTTDNNYGEWSQLFIPIGLYFIKRQVWKVKMFHETVHKTWNLFKHLEQLLENFAKNHVLWLLIGRKFLSIDWVLFSIDQIGIEYQSIHPKAPRLFSYHFDWSSQSFDWSKMLNFEFSLRKFQNLNFHFNNFMKQYSSNSNIITTTYLCIYLYIQHNAYKQKCTNMKYVWF